MRRGAAWTVEGRQGAAWSLPWLRSRWQCCHRRASLGLPSAKRRPHSGGLGVSRRAVFVVVVIEDVRMPSVPFIVSCPRRFWFAMACPVEGPVSGRIRRGRRCPEGCPIVASIVDAGHDRVDVGRGPGLRPFGHRAWVQVVTPGGSPVLVAAGVSRRSMRIAVLFGQGQDERAAWLAVAGWPGAWSDAGRWRCLPLGRRCPDRVRTRRRGGHLELGVSGRPDGREVRHVRRPASHCRVSAGGAGRRRRCPGGCPAAGPWRKRAASWTAGMPARHVVRSSRWPPAVQGWVRGPTSDAGAEACFRHRSGRRTIVEAGGSAGIGKRLPSVGASGPGAVLGGG
jgi:hypothetical protein